MPIVTCSTRTVTSRLRAFAAMSVVKRNAPSSTCSAALNSSLAGCSSDKNQPAVLAELHQAAFRQFHHDARVLAAHDAVARAQLHARHQRRARAVALAPRGHLHALDHRRRLRERLDGRDAYKQREK